MRVVSALAALLMTLSPVVSDAATMTFAYTDYTAFESDYSEDGIHATVGDGYFGAEADGVQHLDDFGTDAPSSVRFAMAGLFDALGFDLTPLDFTLVVCDWDTDDCTAPTYENVLIQGFRQGVAVATLTFDMSVAGVGRVVLDSSFRNLDALEIGVVLPPNGLWGGLPDTLYADCAAPCSHFEIDNVTLAPLVPAVPVPGAALAMATAIAGLVALRRMARTAV